MTKWIKRIITAVFAVAMMIGLMSISAFAEDREVTVTVKWDAAEAENKTIYAWCWSTFENYTESHSWPGDAMTRNEDGTWTTTIHAMFNEKKLGFIPSFESSLPIYINGIPYDYYIQTVDLEIPSSGNVLITVSEEIDPESEWELHLATVEYDGPEWEYEILDDQSVIIQGYLGDEKEIVVPSEIDEHTVKSIASWAFSCCSSISSVTIPESVTEIGYGAFWGCSGLQSINMPSGITSIGEDVFEGCNNLVICGYSDSYVESYTKENNIPFVPLDKEQNYGNVLCGGTCGENSRYMLYDSGTLVISGSGEIGSKAFYDNQEIKMVIINEGIASIGNWAFSGCSSLTSIELPSGITNIGNWAFSGCNNLASIKLPNTLTIICYEAFSGCDNLTINCYSGSYAESYAKENNIPYKLVAESGWKHDLTGWWYDNGEGTYPKSEWKNIEGSWYYFNNSGYMVTGWLQDGNEWYYLESTGKMATGWKQISGSWYFFESNGVMAANKWVNSVYYMKSNGAMAVNEWVDGGRYYVDSNGKWVPNKTKASWKKDAKGWWYDNGDGTYPKSTWKSIDGSWYFFNSSGYMVTGWLNDGGKWYYLETSGKMATSKWINGTYYVKANGVMATNEWVDNGRYYVDANGKWVA